MLLVSLECRYKTRRSSNIKRPAIIELAINSGQILNHLSEYVTAWESFIFSLDPLSL